MLQTSLSNERKNFGFVERVRETSHSRRPGFDTFEKRYNANKLFFNQTSANYHIKDMDVQTQDREIDLNFIGCKFEGNLNHWIGYVTTTVDGIAPVDEVRKVLRDLRSKLIRVPIWFNMVKE